MGSDSVRETFGFRYTPADHLALCNLYAVGHDVVCDPSYRWDSSLRTDGPQMIFQYTLAGEGVLETAGETYRIGPGRAIMAEVPGDFVYYFPQDGESWTFLFIQILPALIAPTGMKPSVDWDRPRSFRRRASRSACCRPYSTRPALAESRMLIQPLRWCTNLSPSSADLPRFPRMTGGSGRSRSVKSPST